MTADTSSAPSRAWYAVSTRSRHERTVERLLARYEIETYLPLQRVWSARRDRRKQIDVPALPGYLFIRCALTPDLRAIVKKAPGVVHLVSIDEQPCRIPDRQIESLRILLLSQNDVHQHSAFETGQAVRIRSGPLKGAQGLLTRVDAGRHRLVVRIEHIGLALSAEVHESDVEPDA